MTVKAKCPQCGHLFSLDSSFIGLVRKCPACQHKFKFDHPIEVEAELPEQPAEDTRDTKLSCAECLRSFAPKAERLRAKAFRCPWCEVLQDVDEAVELNVILDKCDAFLTGSLLGGASMMDVIPQIEEAGLAPTLAMKVYNVHFQELPFRRYGAAKQTETNRLIRPPKSCDLCRSLLTDEDAHNPIFVEWTFKQRGVSMDTAQLFVGRVSIQVEDFLREITGAYFCCEKCESGVKSHRGYPANEGFRFSRAFRGEVGEAGGIFVRSK